jgi:tRNA U34 2-thiouridine synthase MnmA/TrmU
MNVAALISGGVDSSVVVHLLKEQGFDSSLFYLKISNGEDDCSWQDDIVLCQMIAKKYGCPLEVLDLNKEYWDSVVTYMIESVRRGLTPNPDMMCNKFVKFGYFEQMRGKDFDKTATGHYATTAEIDGKVYLATAKDPVKDQTDFLAQINHLQVAKLMFPIGHLMKSEVREIAEQAVPLPTQLGNMSTAAVARRISGFSKIFNSMNGSSPVSVRHTATRTGAMKGTLAGITEGIWRGRKLTESGTPTILVSKVANGKKKSWVVQVPSTAKIIGGENPMDGITDIEAVAGSPNSVSNGVVKALKQAGAKKGDQVVMAGYSLGGIAAVATAVSASYRNAYSPPSVITLGSPIASIPVPEDVRILALEHRQDIYPAIGGPANPRAVTHTTVTRDLARSSDPAERSAAFDEIGTRAHNLKFYENTLKVVDKRTDQALVAFKNAVSPALDPKAKVTTFEFEITRVKKK